MFSFYRRIHFYNAPLHLTYSFSNFLFNGEGFPAKNDGQFTSSADCIPSINYRPLLPPAAIGVNSNEKCNALICWLKIVIHNFLLRETWLGNLRVLMQIMHNIFTIDLAKLNGLIWVIVATFRPAVVEAVDVYWRHHADHRRLRLYFVNELFCISRCRFWMQPTWKVTPTIYLPQYWRFGVYWWELCYFVCCVLQIVLLAGNRGERSSLVAKWWVYTSRFYIFRFSWKYWWKRMQPCVCLFGLPITDVECELFGRHLVCSGRRTKLDCRWTAATSTRWIGDCLLCTWCDISHGQ